MSILKLNFDLLFNEWGDWEAQERLVICVLRVSSSS